MSSVKEALDPIIKIFGKLPYHILCEPLGLISSKIVCIFSGIISGQKDVAPVAILLAPIVITNGSKWQ